MREVELQTVPGNEPVRIAYRMMLQGVLQGDYPREELGRDACGLICETPGCVVSDVMLLLSLGEFVILLMVVEHQHADGSRHIGLRVVTDPVPAVHAATVRTSALELWDRDRPVRQATLQKALANKKSKCN